MYLSKRQLMKMFTVFFVMLFIEIELFHSLIMGFKVSLFGLLIGGLLANSVEKQIALQRHSTVRFICGCLVFILVSLSLFTLFF